MHQRPSFARDAGAVAATLFGTALLATLIDPYLSLRDAPPLAVAINAVIPVLVAMATLALSGRWLLAVPAGGLACALLAAADHFKMQALYDNLLFADLALVPALARQPGLVLGFASIDATGWALLAAGAASAGVAAFLALRRPPLGRGTRGVVALVFLGGCVAVTQARVSHAVPAIGWLLPMQIAGAHQAGVSGNVLLGGMASNRAKPRASAGAVAAFWSDPLVQAARDVLSRRIPGPRPDIVFVQSESLFEPSLLCGMDDTPVLQALSRLPGTGFENLAVPVFGHRTLQTEFEVLSGFPVRFAPQSRFAYYDLVDRPIDALPRHLGALGYRTIALHPSRRSFWRRDHAFPAMGFDTFIDGSAYVRATDFSRFGWVSDLAMTRTILSQLDDDSPVPTLVFAVSIENHGPWGTQGAPAGPDARDAGLRGAARTAWLDYVDRARRADENLAILLAALERRRRPTMVVFYGDHLPALGNVQAQACFKDGRPPAAHSPPLRIWSNFDPGATVDVQAHAYLLSARVLHMAGLPLEGAFLAGAITDRIQRDDAIDNADKQRILALYAHVAAHAVFGSPVAAERPTAFIGSRQANDVLLGMQAVGPPPARRRDGAQARGASWPANAGEVTFDLRKRVAAMVLRPWTRWDARCLATPMTLDLLADGQVVARARLDRHAVAIQALPLSGVDTLTLRVQDAATLPACAQVGVEVSQVQCYAPACAVPGERTAHAKRAPAAGRADFDAMQVALSRATAGSGPAGPVDTMLARATGHEAAQPVRVTPDAGLFLHPAVGKPAWMEFDVEGLAAVTLAPVIQPLSAACLGNATAGVVRLDVSLDGREVERVDVDRDYRGQVHVAFDGARRLRVAIDAGNGVTWCDWASVGVPALEHAPGLQR